MHTSSSGLIRERPAFPVGTLSGVDVAVAPPGWWARNWKWAVPAGVSVLVAGFVGFCALIVMLVFGVMKHSEVYQTAVSEAQAEPAVIGALGVPIEEGLFVTGNIQISGPSGSADLAIPVSGPDGNATIYVVAEKRAGAWQYSTLEVAVHDTGETIDLLDDW